MEPWEFDESLILQLHQNHQSEIQPSLFESLLKSECCTKITSNYTQAVQEHEIEKIASKHKSSQTSKAVHL